MGYIREVRALVGNRPLVLVSAMVLMLDDEGRLLMQRRAATGAWHVPGGYLEPGEARADGEEGDAVRFFGLRELPDDLGPPARPVLADLRGRGVLG